MIKERIVTLRNDTFADVIADLDAATIRLHWKGYAPSPVFRGILEDAMGSVRTYGITRWLADLRDMKAILRQDELWTVQEWFPKLASAGLRRMAILTSTDYFNQMSVDRIMNDAAPVIPFIVSYFDDPDMANIWLASDTPA